MRIERDTARSRARRASELRAERDLAITETENLRAQLRGLESRYSRVNAALRAMCDRPVDLTGEEDAPAPQPQQRGTKRAVVLPRCVICLNEEADDVHVMWCCGNTVCCACTDQMEATFTNRCPHCRRNVFERRMRNGMPTVKGKFTKLHGIEVKDVVADV